MIVALLAEKSGVGQRVMLVDAGRQGSSRSGRRHAPLSGSLGWTRHRCTARRSTAGASIRSLSPLRQPVRLVALTVRSFLRVDLRTTFMRSRTHRTAAPDMQPYSLNSIHVPENLQKAGQDWPRRLLELSVVVPDLGGHEYPPILQEVVVLLDTRRLHSLRKTL